MTSMENSIVINLSTVKTAKWSQYYFVLIICAIGHAGYKMFINKK